MTTKIESLETRSLLATITWDGPATGGYWDTAANWSGDVVPGPGDDVTISNATLPPPPNASVNSLTLEAGANLQSTPGAGVGPMRLTIGTQLTLRTGSSIFAVAGRVFGTGKMLIEAGAGFSSYSGFSGGFSSGIEIPVDNYGGVGLDASPVVGGRASVGPNFRNYGSLGVRGGVLDGVITNEATGVITSSGSPMTGSSTLLGTYGGVAVPFVNYGLIKPLGSGGGDTGLTPDYSAFGASCTITIDLSASPTIGGKWHSSRGILSFISTTSTPAITTFDESFELIDGTIHFNNVIANVRNLPVDSGIVVIGANARVNLLQNITALALMDVRGGTVAMPAGGNRILHVQDARVAVSAKLDLGDNLFIAGNEPGYRQPTAFNVPAPTPSPTFSSRIIGILAGNPIAVDGTSKYAVGYSRGDGLAGLYPSNTFHGQSFEADDFVFFPTLRGDTNFDRAVNFDDLFLVAKRYGLTTSLGYAGGNFDQPAVENSPIDFNDLLAVAQNYETSLAIGSPSAVPAKGKTRIGSAREILV